MKEVRCWKEWYVTNNEHILSLSKVFSLLLREYIVNLETEMDGGGGGGGGREGCG